MLVHDSGIPPIKLCERPVNALLFLFMNPDGYHTRGYLF